MSNYLSYFLYGFCGLIEEHSSTLRRHRLVPFSGKEPYLLKTKLILFATILTLLFAACVPVLTENPIPTEEPIIPVTGAAIVQSVEIQILESQPLQVNALVCGQMPDAQQTQSP